MDNNANSSSSSSNSKIDVINEENSIISSSKYAITSSTILNAEEEFENNNNNFKGQNRNLKLNYDAFFRYYFVDFTGSIIGPILNIPLAVAVFGVKGAKTMMYLPSSLTLWIFGMVFGHLFWFIWLLPLLESVLILAGIRPTSNFDPLSEGLVVLISLLLVPLPSAAKYGYMSKEKFETKILGSNSYENLNIAFNSKSDNTVEAIGKWLSPLSNELITEEVMKAIWRSGDPMDGKRFKLNLVNKDSNKDQSPSKIKAHASENKSYNLAQVLISIVRRKNGNELFQFNGKYSIRLLFFFTSLISCINPLYKTYVLKVPSFGSDWFEITAAVCMIPFFGFIFIAGNVVRPLIGASGHLARGRRILNDYNNLLLPPLNNHAISLHQTGKTDNHTNGNIEHDNIGSLKRPVPPIILTPDQVKIWARGREALLLFGEVYWLRLSVYVGSVFLQFFVLLLFLMVQVIMALLSNDGNMQMSAFIIFISTSVVIFVGLFSLVVIEGIKITYANKKFRTNLLRRAQYITLLKTEESKEVAIELRNLALVLESELQSNPIRLLGLKLNFTMMESLIGGLGVVVVGIYQTFTS